jgi:hypothetical protein
VPPANPSAATATTPTYNHDLRSLYEFVDLGAVLGDAQWDRVSGSWRDDPPDRSDAGNSNGGTRQNIGEHRTTTHIHVFAPLVRESFSGSLMKPKISGSLRATISARLSRWANTDHLRARVIDALAATFLSAVPKAPRSFQLPANAVNTALTPFSSG